MGSIVKEPSALADSKSIAEVDSESNKFASEARKLTGIRPSYPAARRRPAGAQVDH